jgi:hypothetical protein
MFRQVVGTMFTCLEKYGTEWKSTEAASEVERIGENGYTVAPDPKEVDFQFTINAFKSNFDSFVPVYKTMLNDDILGRFEQLKNEFSSTVLKSEVWAKLSIPLSPSFITCSLWKELH